MTVSDILTAVVLPISIVDDTENQASLFFQKAVIDVVNHLTDVLVEANKIDLPDLQVNDS